MTTTYNPEIQYRCTIIRWKAKKDLDNLLPRYATILSEICPCSIEEFWNLFNQKLWEYIEWNKKTLDNHRTEIAWKLFWMYYEDWDIVNISERTLALLENEDQPAFFKDICSKFQFPNGMDSVHTLMDRLSNNISIKPFSFILEVLLLAEKKWLFLTKDEVGYFILNQLQVLQWLIEPNIILDTIISYRKANIHVKVEWEWKASSYNIQHINELLWLLELANIIRINMNSWIILNPYEQESINYISSLWDTPLDFNVYQYDLDTVEGRKLMYNEWQHYFCDINKSWTPIFQTTLNAIKFNIEEVNGENKIRNKTRDDSKNQLWDDWENYVYEYEKSRVSQYDSRLVNKVLLLWKTRWIGYDIQSIFADHSERSEFVKYIEVKATKRVTLPTETIDWWIDTLSLTRNEWVAAEQHTLSYSIYRVYFTPEQTVIYIMTNPFQKNIDRKIKCIPTMYRLDFSSDSIDLITT
jgi:hypothetical protein